MLLVFYFSRVIFILFYFIEVNKTPNTHLRHEKCNAQKINWVIFLNKLTLRRLITYTLLNN